MILVTFTYRVVYSVLYGQYTYQTITYVYQIIMVLL